MPQGGPTVQACVRCLFTGCWLLAHRSRPGGARGCGSHRQHLVSSSHPWGCLTRKTCHDGLAWMEQPGCWSHASPVLSQTPPRSPGRVLPAGAPALHPHGQDGAELPLWSRGICPELRTLTSLLLSSFLLQGSVTAWKESRHSP